MRLTFVYLLSHYSYDSVYLKIHIHNIVAIYIKDMKVLAKSITDPVKRLQEKIGLEIKIELFCSKRLIFVMICKWHKSSQDH